MARRKIQVAVVFTLALLGFLGTANLGIQYSLNRLLVNEAGTTGMDWARHIEARIPKLPNMTNRGQVPDTKQFAGLVSDILSIGNVFQIDYINSDCLCEISLGSYNNAGPKKQVTTKLFGAGSHNPSDGHNHKIGDQAHTPVTEVAPPNRGIMKHVFLNEKQHKPMNMTGKGNLQTPIDRVLVRSIIEKQTRNIFIRSSSTQEQPTTFAELYHPVTLDGEVAYILRLLVNLENKAVLYSQLLYSGFFCILLLLALAFGYPAGKYIHTSARQRKTDERARFLANYDVMTNVSNRNAFQDQAPKILQSCAANGQSAAIFLFDIDKFKRINDHHSHEAGDLVICALAEKLKNAVPGDCLVARLGGDEFAVMIGGLDEDDDKLLRVLEASTELRVQIDGNRQIIETTVSAGVARFPRDGGNLEELMRNADLALYAAKSEQGGKICEYAPQMSMDFYERLDLRDEFKEALANSEIVPFYQPLVNMNSGQVEGFEALARWNHPKKGILSPLVFEEMLNDHELGALVGTMMLKKIVQDMKRWKSKGVRFESVGLNVGEADLLHPHFAKNVLSELSQNGLRTKNLAIEITETCMFGVNKNRFVEQLEELRDAGCYIALDDFGTGFSSITQIKELPCTAVKIDKSFVNNVVSDLADQSIIKSLLELGRTLGFKLVLEGIETPEQLKLLKSLGCELAQGYYHSRPVPASEVPALIEKLNDEAFESDQMRMVA